MKHKFSDLIITVGFNCEECKMYVESRKIMSKNELEQYVLGQIDLRAMKLEEGYKELDRHECIGINEGTKSPYVYPLTNELYNALEKARPIMRTNGYANIIKTVDAALARAKVMLGR